MKISGLRWLMIGLVFLATVINYIDRQTVSVLKTSISQDLGLSNADYAAVQNSFLLFYGISQMVSGRLYDIIGTRLGFVFSIVVWSGAALAHAAARTATSFGVFRGMLGFGEAGNFPAAIKVTAEWFPKKERALATGIFNSGTNVGAVLTPLVGPSITLYWGWYWAFIITGALGFLWLFFWIPIYRSPEHHPRVGAAELAHIRSDAADLPVKIPWLQLLKYRQTWAFALGKFLTDPVWWLYLFWIPDFLGRSYGIDLKTIGPPLIAIYLIADVGSIGGGWLSSALLKRGWSVNAGRKTAMLVCALAVLPMAFASKATGLWSAVALVSLAASAHQGWSANLFTLTSDMFPRKAVGSVVGLGGFAGAVGGMLIAKITGYILETTGSYIPIFFIAAFAYLVALAVIQVLVPRIEPVKLD